MFFRGDKNYSCTNAIVSHNSIEVYFLRWEDINEEHVFCGK